MNFQIVTIDGKRGTGKSRLASALRAYFDCGVLDIGPLFRLLTWFIRSGMTQNPEDAYKMLGELWHGKSDLLIDLHSGGTMSATKIEFRGRDMESTLWQPAIDDLLPTVSEDEPVIRSLGNLIRTMVKDSPTIVVGRNTGVQLFSDALLKIRLVADDAIRQERKLRQLSEEFEMSGAMDIERSEPFLENLQFDDYATLDTSRLAPDQAFRSAKNLISSRVLWTPRNTNES
ncbi:MAG TPA: (d)CMP kinase [Thermoanaerobaculia bacterium]